MKPLSARQEQVLQATVHHYVDTIEPVGSRTLVQRFGIKASSATVRSAMGVLERRGLLTQPHTSAGRIPSALGYRRYVDDLLPEPGIAVHHRGLRVAASPVPPPGHRRAAGRDRPTNARRGRHPGERIARPWEASKAVVPEKPDCCDQSPRAGRP